MLYAMNRDGRIQPMNERNEKIEKYKADIERYSMHSEISYGQYKMRVKQWEKAFAKYKKAEQEMKEAEYRMNQEWKRCCTDELSVQHAKECLYFLEK